jgi:hypothetical protein
MERQNQTDRTVQENSPVGVHESSLAGKKPIGTIAFQAAYVVAVVVAMIVWASLFGYVALALLGH